MEPEPQREAAPEQDVVFHLEVSISARYLTAVRRFIAELTESVVHDSELASRMGLATHELLENAVKYASDATRLVTLQLRVEGQRRVHVTVVNASNAALVTPLRELVHELNEAPDPIATYQLMIARSMKQDTGSGLGLARIVAEAEMRLSCDFDGDLLSVSAQATIGDVR